MDKLHSGRIVAHDGGRETVRPIRLVAVLVDQRDGWGQRPRGDGLYEIQSVELRNVHRLMVASLVLSGVSGVVFWLCLSSMWAEASFGGVRGKECEEPGHGSKTWMGGRGEISSLVRRTGRDFVQDARGGLPVDAKVYK